MITPLQANEMLARLERNRHGRGPKPESCAAGVESEVADLHRPILAWCRNQVPAVPVFYTRPDRASGAFPGTPDFALIYKGRCLLIEAKTKRGKLSTEQLAWHHLAARQGHTVHVIRSMEEFWNILRDLGL